MLQQHIRKIINAHHLQSSNVHPNVTSLLQYTYTDDGPRSGRRNLGTINYGKFINQFLPDTIKLIWLLERINTKGLHKRCL